MTITAIKQQSKSNDRYSIFVDDKYSFSLSEGELIASGVHNGQVLTRIQLDEFKDKSKVDKNYGLVLRLIARRSRSETEIKDYLKRKNQDDETIKTILNKLSKIGLIDDEDFANRWVENRRLIKPTSQRKLQLELRQKGISSDIINKVLEADTVTDLDTLKNLIERKRRQTKYQDDLKLMQFLARQGFNYSDIKSALSDN